MIICETLSHLPHSNMCHPPLLSPFQKRSNIQNQPTQQKHHPMKMIKTLLLTSCLATLAVGCASPGGDAASKKKKYPTTESVLNVDYVKKNSPTIYQHSIEEVRPAAARALSFVGCKIETQEDFYVEGKRPNKMGFFVGSGGETVKVFLNPSSTNQTQVWADTDLSFVGIVGQKSWNQQVLDEMTRILNKP